MKKLKGLLAILAIVFAGAGVYTTSVAADSTTYWVDNPASPSTICDTSVTNVCPAGSGPQCNSSSAGNKLVFKIVSGGSCAQHLRQ